MSNKSNLFKKKLMINNHKMQIKSYYTLKLSTIQMYID